MKFKTTVKVEVPEDVLYRFSVDEWRDWLVKRYDIDPETVTTFESVGEYIVDLWLRGFYEFQDKGIIPTTMTVECLG